MAPVEPLVLAYGPWIYAALLLLAVLAGVAWIRGRVRRAGLAEAAAVLASPASASEGLIHGARVTLRGRLSVDSAPVRGLADRREVAVTSIHGDGDRVAAGRPDRLWFSDRAEGLALEVTPRAGAAPIRVSLVGAIHVRCGSAEFRARARLRRLRRLRARIVASHPEEGPQMDLDFIVERSLVAGDQAAITGTLTREERPEGPTWTLGAVDPGGPFRRGDGAEDRGIAGLSAAHEGPPRRLWTSARHGLGLGLALAALVAVGIHALAPRLLPSLGRDDEFDPREVAALTPTLIARSALAGLSPLHRRQALFELARAVEFQPQQDAESFAWAMELHTHAGGCPLAVAAAASTHPEWAAARAAESCPEARGAAFADYALGRFESAAAILAAHIDDPAARGARRFAGERAWEIETLLLGRRPEQAAALLRGGAAEPVGGLAGIFRERPALLAEPGSADDLDHTLADALDHTFADPATIGARLARLANAADEAAAILALADSLAPAARFELLDAIDPSDLADDDARVAWWLLRAEIRPDVAWRAPARGRVGPRGKGSNSADPADELPALLRGPPLMSSDPAAYLETVQPLPDYPWGLVFAVARELVARPPTSIEGRRTLARVTHAAGVFELLAGEVGEAQRWLAITADECARGELFPGGREDRRQVCDELPGLRAVVALFARDWEAAAAHLERWGGPRASRAAIRTFLERARGDRDFIPGVWVSIAEGRGRPALVELAQAGRLEHAALRIAGTPALADDLLLTYLRWSRAPGACVPSVSRSLLPATVARAETLAALGDLEGAAAMRASARRIRARLQEREGAVALWLVRPRSECINNIAGARALHDKMRQRLHR